MSSRVYKLLLLCLLLLVGGTAGISAQIDVTQHRRFAERLVLAADEGQMDGKPIETYLKEEKIAFMKGGLGDLRRALRDPAISCQVTLREGKRYALCFFRQIETPEVVISYPASYQLILGTTMMQAEDRLFADVWSTPIPPATDTPIDLGNTDISSLQRIGNGPVYLAPGTSYIIPELNNNRYYVMLDDSTFRFLYSDDMPQETMANLVTTTEIENNLKLAIKLVKYGYRTESATIPLRQWVTYSIAQGCTPYFGVISKESEKVVCELIMHNEGLGYAHVMKFEFNPAILASRTGTMPARLNSYVPVSNVKSLFKESTTN